MHFRNVCDAHEYISNHERQCFVQFIRRSTTAGFGNTGKCLLVKVWRQYNVDSRVYSAVGGVTNYRIGPHTTTSDRIGPLHTTYDRIGPHGTNSDRIRPHRTAT